MCNFAKWIVGGHVPMTSGKPITASTLHLIGLLKRYRQMRGKKMTKEEFVSRANIKHGDGRYCYDDSFYRGVNKPIKIKCNVCGNIFPQTPNSHLNGCGCPVCAIQKKKHFKPVCGVGVNDLTSETQQTKGYITPSYRAWHSMLYRCYNEEGHKRQPTYKDCSVCDEWKVYSVFKRWFDENYVDGCSLDKDIIVKGNRVYSPETCCFIPSEINIIFTKRQKHRGDLPIGVFHNYNGFGAKVNVYGKSKRLGTYKTKGEAFAAYKREKEAYIKEVAQKYYDEGKITKRVYDALMRYEVEITD